MKRHPSPGTLKLLLGGGRNRERQEHEGRYRFSRAFDAAPLHEADGALCEARQIGPGAIVLQLIAQFTKDGAIIRWSSNARRWQSAAPAGSPQSRSAFPRLRC